MRAILSALILLAAAGPAWADTLEIVIRDQDWRIIPARVLVKPKGADCSVPPDAAFLRIGSEIWFASPGHSVVQVPPGEVEIRVERGPEYTRVKETVRIMRRKKVHNVTLRRWVHMKRRGWLSGENHLHVDSGRLAQALPSEDLNFGMSLTWWRGPDHRRPVPPGEGKVRILEWAGKKTPCSIFDAELEYGWGAAYITNLPAPMPIKADKRRPNLDYVKHAVEAGAIVHYQGGWSREAAPNALLGYVHTVNVCNNNFHLHRFQPRKRYSNLLEVEGFPDYEETPEGMMRMNTETYYRLLNWGLRLAAGAGSATGAKETPVGFNRAYVRVPPRASIDHFYEAWAEGRNFVTNGPMLLLRTANNERPGGTIELPAAGGRVRLHVEAISEPRIPLTAIEIVVNGEVAETIKVADPGRTLGTVEVEIKKGSWIAARCTARDELLTDEELAAYDNGNAQNPCRLRFAHTSPIYVTVGGKSVAVRKSIDEGLRMLQNFGKYAEANAGEKYKPGILEAVEQAKSILGERLKVAD